MTGPLIDLAAAWIKYQSCLLAAEAIERLCRKGPQAALECVLAILEQDRNGPQEMLMQNLSAGPFEDLLCYHGVALIE